MAWVSGDRVRETTTTTGTGSITLAGAATGFLAFSARVSNGDKVFYAIAGSTEWEVGYGTWTTGGHISRDTVLASSNADALVSFSAGSKDVFLDFPAMQAQFPITQKIANKTLIVPVNASLVVSDFFEVASGVTVEVEAGSSMEVT